jgi:2-C-methyl-D-erythritol 4-phosphate cytidylyltransferase
MNTAILVAAGKGTRMGADKLFLELAGRPVIAHTWQRFNETTCIDDILLIVGEGRQREFERVAARFDFRKPFRILTGGAERQDSVWNGLQAASKAAEIAVLHDAARPCVNSELITATIKHAEETGAAVAAHPVTDTIKESADGRLIQHTLDRSKLWAMETPQTFRIEVIRRAIAEARAKKMIFTDDTAACELIGQPVRLVSSIAPNPKITVPGDLPIIEALLQKS